MALAWIHRRKKFRPAWRTPSAIAASPSGISRVRLPRAIAWSITDLVRSGITISVVTPAIAAASMNAIRP
jgi:hypothetical protein